MNSDNPVSIESETRVDTSPGADHPVSSTNRATTGACAHRGDSTRERENTIAAVRSAIAAGARFVEIDVRLSSDGEVVVLHDATLDRLWGLDAEVSGVDWPTVAALGKGDLRVPLLSEVLELFVGCASTLLIDMENPDPAEAAWRVAGRSSALVAWCGHLDGMRTIRRLDPAARIWMPWSAAQSPTADEVAELAPEYVNANYLDMTRAMVHSIHALGLRVAVWTVDDEASMRWALRMGVDSVTTNRLARLQRIIEENPTGGATDVEQSDNGAGGVNLDAALAVARELAQWAIDFASGTDPGEILTKKDPADLVTEVDVAVERHVREVIGELFPSHGFVGEEMGGEALPGIPCWYLDPVDGTTNFANRVPWNAFSLALLVDHTPLVAVVADPWRADLFEAVTGRGAKLNGRTLTVPAASGAGGAADPLSGHIVSTELASHQAWPGMLDMLEELSSRHCTVRIMGSGTMTMVGIAAGRGVGSVIGTFGPVDHLAAMLIVIEAGGVVLDSDGNSTTFPQSGGVMAAAPEAATAVFEVWKRATTADSVRSAATNR